MSKLSCIRNFFCASALAVLSVCAFSGCAGKEEPRYKVGVSQPCDDEWRQKMNSEIRREMLFHDDIAVEFRSGDNDSRKQISDIRHFIEDGVDLIIVAPNEAQTVTPILEEALQKGIAVVTFDRNVYGNSYTSHFEPDNEEIGHQAALYARHIISGTVNALEIRGLDYSTPAQQRHDGFERGSRSLPDFNMISVGGDWNPPSAKRITDSVLNVHPEINVVYAHNDGMAIAASATAKALGRHDIKIIGTDAAPSPGLKAIDNNLIDASVMYPTEGSRVFRSAADILHGKQVPKEDRLGNNAVVDHTNADILIRQNDLLRAETDKIEHLKMEIEKLGISERNKTNYLYMLLASALLLLLGVAVLIMYLRQGQRYHKILAQKNSQLEVEKQKQQELYDRLEEVTRSKMIFYTNVSHDLRTPLSLISGPIERLTQSKGLDDRERELANVAARNVSILRRLINQILDFRKIDNGTSDLHLAEADFMALASEWVSDFRSLAIEQDIDLRLELPSSGQRHPQTMAIDVEKIERVVFNLLGNAFRYTPSNGCITFRATFEGENLVFSVIDSGKGIKPEDLSRIFERFYQVEKYSYTGSGIGLSLAKAMVELHGGSVTASSLPETPTTFTVTIPIRHVAEKYTPPKDRIKSTVARERLMNSLSRHTPAAEIEEESDKPLLLIADDNEDLRKLVRSVMEEKFRIIEAADGQQTLALATRYVPDIIVCDIIMPGMPGIEVCRILKEEVATSHIPVLMLTACLLDEQRIESYKSGADGFLGKPFDSEMLMARCENLLANRKRVSGDSGVPVVKGAERSKSSPGAVSAEDSLVLESDFYRDFLNIVRPMLCNAELNTEMIAERMGLGPAQITRKIKALTNYTPIEIVRKMRLQNAHTMLMSTEQSVSEIAYSTGFSSPAYLSKCFKDMYGVSPREFRVSLSREVE